MVIAEESRTIIARNAITLRVRRRHRQFINQYTARGYSNEVKENCLKMYVNGLGFRAQGVCAQVQRLSPQSHAMHDDGALAPFLRRFKALLCAKE